MNFETYLVFAVTTAVIIFSPGPTAILAASQGAGSGMRGALVGIFGVTCATMIYFVLSATGIASLIVASHALFLAIKWVGVAYLVYLGGMALFSKSGGLLVKAGRAEKKLSSLYLQGFIVEFANPKALLYFAAILPQFLDISRPIALQFLEMGATAFIMQITIYSAYAYMGDRLTNGGVKAWLVSSINKVAGGALLFASIKMASVTATSR